MKSKIFFKKNANFSDNLLLFFISLFAIFNLLFLLFYILPSTKLDIKYSPPYTIESFITEMINSPEEYTIVIGNYSPIEEISLAGKFAGSFGIPNSALDYEKSLNDTKLILIGNPNFNLLTKNLINNFDYQNGDSLIKVFLIDNKKFLIIAAISFNDTENAINKIINYQNFSIFSQCISVKINGENLIGLDCNNGTYNIIPTNTSAGSSGGGSGGGGGGNGENSNNKDIRNTTKINEKEPIINNISKENQSKKNSRIENITEKIKESLNQSINLKSNKRINSYILISIIILIFFIFLIIIHNFKRKIKNKNKYL